MVFDQDRAYDCCICSSDGILRNHVNNENERKARYFAGDARLKKLILTPLGEEMHFKTKQTLDSLELQIRKDLTKEEIETFFNVSDKIRKNLGEKEECIHKRIKD